MSGAINNIRPGGSPLPAAPLLPPSPLAGRLPPLLPPLPRLPPLALLQQSEVSPPLLLRAGQEGAGGLPLPPARLHRLPGLPAPLPLLPHPWLPPRPGDEGEPGDVGLAHRHLLLRPWPPLPTLLHLQVQGHCGRGSKEALSTRMPQCLPAWWSSQEVCLSFFFLVSLSCSSSPNSGSG